SAGSRQPAPYRVLRRHHRVAARIRPRDAAFAEVHNLDNALAPGRDATVPAILRSPRRGAVDTSGVGDRGSGVRRTRVGSQKSRVTASYFPEPRIPNPESRARVGRSILRSVPRLGILCSPRRAALEFPVFTP